MLSFVFVKVVVVGSREYSTVEKVRIQELRGMNPFGNNSAVTASSTFFYLTLLVPDH